jgi:hypothetical protein
MNATSAFGTVTTAGVNPVEAVEMPEELQLRNILRDPSPVLGWSVEWRIEDRYGLREAGADVRLRYTDLTSGAQALLGESWVVAGSFNAVVNCSRLQLWNHAPSPWDAANKYTFPAISPVATP